MESEELVSILRKGNKIVKNCLVDKSRWKIEVYWDGILKERIYMNCIEARRVLDVLLALDFEASGEVF